MRFFPRNIREGFRLLNLIIKKIRIDDNEILTKTNDIAI